MPKRRTNKQIQKRVFSGFVPYPQYNSKKMSGILVISVQGFVLYFHCLKSK